MEKSGCGATISLGFWIAICFFACSMVTVGKLDQAFHTGSVAFLVVAFGPWAVLFTFALIYDILNGIFSAIGAILGGVWNIITGTIEFIDDQIWRVIRWWKAYREKQKPE